MRRKGIAARVAVIRRSHRPYQRLNRFGQLDWLALGVAQQVTITAGYPREIFQLKIGQQVMSSGE
jgi:hypothetical protein